MIYADTSVLVAWFYPADRFAEAVTAWCQARGPEFHWNEVLRAELRHNLRRLAGPHGAIAWRAYRAAETTGRLRLHPRRLADILDWGDELSARFASQTDAGTWDCVHVAAALKAGVAVFATADEAQARLAELAGLAEVKLFRGPAG